MHFKGNLYYVHDICEDPDNDTLLVVYQALYAPYKMYSRDLRIFASEVDVDRPDNVTGQKYRFELYGDI